MELRHVQAMSRHACFQPHQIATNTRSCIMDIMAVWLLQDIHLIMRSVRLLYNNSMVVPES